MLNDETKRDIEEAYASAGSSSSLRMLHSDLGSRNDVDVIAAAGMVRCRLGMTLLRLRSEWDRASKPTEPTEAQIKLWAQSMLRIKAPLVLSPARLEWHRKREPARRHALAKREAKDWHARALGQAFDGLRSMRAVRADAHAYAMWLGLDVTAPVVADVIAWWLDSRCVPQPPHGPVGRRLANYLDDCKGRATSNLKKRLRTAQSAS